MKDQSVAVIKVIVSIECSDHGYKHINYVSQRLRKQNKNEPYKTLWQWGAVDMMWPEKMSNNLDKHHILENKLIQIF